MILSLAYEFFPGLINLSPDISDAILIRPPNTPLTISANAHAHPLPPKFHLAGDPTPSAEVHLTQSARKQLLEKGSYGAWVYTGSYKNRGRRRHP